MSGSLNRMILSNFFYGYIAHNFTFIRNFVKFC